MEINVGDKFKSTMSEVEYTVLSITERYGKLSIEWDCVGRKVWYKRVAMGSIVEWIDEGRLIHVPSFKVNK